MTILQLEYFQYLARTLHLKHTAEHFYVSPPAIAASIKRVEMELSTELFVCQGKKLSLTEAGRIFLHYVDDMLRSLDTARKEITADAEDDSLSIAIASPILWSSLFQEFMHWFPDIKINSTLTKVEQLRDPDVNRQFDFVFCASTDMNHPSFDSVQIPMNTKPCLAVYNTHRFASRDSIRLSEAKDERFIALSRGYSFRDYFDMLCRLAGFTPNIVLECEFQFRADMLAAEYGILVTTKSVEETGALGNVKYLDISDPMFTRTMVFCWNKTSRNKTAAERFFRFVGDYYHLSLN